MEDDRSMDQDIESRSGDREREHQREQERAGLVEAPVAIARRFHLPAVMKDRWQVPLVLGSIVAILAAASFYNLRNGGPSTTQLLRSASACIERGDLEEASALLAEVQPRLDGSKIALEARFHATIGDWHAASEEDILASSSPKASAIVGAYSRAIACGWSPDQDQSLDLADGLVVSGRQDHAEEAYRALLGSGKASVVSAARARLRLLVRSQIMDAIFGASDADALALLDAFAALEPLPAEEAWAVATRGGFLLDSGQHQGLIVRVVAAMRRLEANDDGLIEWAPLHVLLGRAYLATGRPGSAGERFRFVLEDLAATGDPRGVALSFLGAMHLAAGEAELAEEAFTMSLETDGVSAAAHDRSRLGLARSHAQQARHDDAAESFSLALAETRGSDVRAAESIAEAARDEGLAAILLASEHDHEEATTLLNAAITYAELAADAAVDRQSERDAIRLKGVAHETLARTTLRPMIGSMDPREAPLGAVSLTSRIEANHDFVAAGEAYLQLNSLLDAGSVESDGRLVWDAATAFDMGGRPTLAIPLYEQFVRERPLEDDHRPEALFRLALASHALLELENAARWYRLMIEEAEDVDPLLRTSSYSTRARVGLARCLAGGEHPTEAALEEAEKHLRLIVDGHGVVGPDAPEYREAMFQLGRVLYAQQQWPDAVEVLETTLKRYAGDVRAPEYAARAGLAWTALAQDAAAQLETSPLSPSHQADIKAAQEEALEAAIGRFGAAIAALDSPSMAVLDPLQRHLLRESYLRRADALATLGQYEEAMEEYASIERRFGEEMTAIEALVRMSNLALENGDSAAAQRATARAATKLRHFDTKGFEGPGLLDGIGTDALAQWIAMQPPGGRNNGAVD